MSILATSERVGSIPFAAENSYLFIQLLQLRVYVLFECLVLGLLILNSMIQFIDIHSISQQFLLDHHKTLLYYTLLVLSSIVEQWVIGTANICFFIGIFELSNTDDNIFVIYLNDLLQLRLLIFADLIIERAVRLFEQFLVWGCQFLPEQGS